MSYSDPDQPSNKYEAPMNMLRQGLNDMDLFIDSLLQYKITPLELMDEILQGPFSEDQYSMLFGLANVIFADSSVAARGLGEARLEATAEAAAFQKYMYRWGRLRTHDIPFKEWSDLAEVGVDILAAMRISGDWDYLRNPRYQDLKKDYLQRYELLRDQKGYTDLGEWHSD